MNTLAIILARAGSVGLPSKHLLQLLGKPVLEYTFDHAAAATSLSHTVLSTDCPKLKLMAGARGLATVDRPARLATSDASVQDALLHALDVTEQQSGATYDAVVLLYGNVPVRPRALIDDGVALLRRSGCDSVRSFTPVGKWHPAWMATVEGSQVVPFRAGSVHRRQDLEPLFLHDGGVVAVSRASLLGAKTNLANPHAFFGTDRQAVQTEMGSVIEIDHQRDLYWADAVLRSQGLTPNRRCTDHVFERRIA